jgi:membrane protein YqaA with SNARE-associated domain
MWSDLGAALRAWADGAGAAGILVISVVDSMALPLPNATDALILYLTVQQPELWWWYAAAGIAGAVAGSLPLYWIGRRGGQALLDRRFDGRRTAAAVRWYRRSAFGAILVPAFLPPPLPFKIFAVLAGATGLTLWRFVLALSLGRGARHVAEALLAAAYGPQAIAMFETHGPRIAAVSAGAVLASAAAVAWRRRVAGRHNRSTHAG